MPAAAAVDTDADNEDDRALPFISAGEFPVPHCCLSTPVFVAVESLRVTAETATSDEDIGSLLAGAVQSVWDANDKPF